MPVYLKNVFRFTRDEDLNTRYATTMDAASPSTPSYRTVRASVFIAAAPRKSMVSMPSLNTEIKASTNRPRAWFESTFSRILDEIYLLSRAIQIIIEVSTAAAISITMPSKSSSFLPANSIASALNTSAAPMLPSTASPVAAYTCLFYSVRFVCKRYARIIPTMRNASRPSRNVIMKLGIIFCSPVFVGVF